jgi:membrane protease YdiL (CAAX protease family)
MAAVREDPPFWGGERIAHMSAVRRHPLITFFVLTYALSWGFLPIKALGFLPAGPLIAALIVIPITQGLSGLKELGLRMIRWRVGLRWYAVAIGLPLAVLLITVALNVSLGAGAPSLAGIDSLSTILLVFAVRLINPLDGPMGEEPGWRGFALPRMQADRSPLTATLILAVLVTIWHVPLFFLEGGLHPFEPSVVLGGLLGPFAFTFVATWLFNHTGGSVLMTIVMHATEGTVHPQALWSASGPAAQAGLVYSLVYCIVAIGLVIFDWQLWRGPAPAPTIAQPVYGGESRVR